MNYRNDAVFVVRRSGDNMENELQHWGTKGMRWGYTDGQKNGNRTAEEYKREAMLDSAKAALGVATAEVNRDLADEQKNYANYYKYDKELEAEKKRSKKIFDKNDNVQGLGYKIGFALGRTVRDCKRQIDKGRRFLSKFFD